MIGVRQLAKPLWGIKVRRDVPWIPVFVVGLLLFCAILAPILAPNDPTRPSISNALIPPGQSADYPLGTDTLGRDILSRLIYGARSSATVAFLALGASAIVGTILGLVSGFFGGRVDVGIMRAVDVGLAFPAMLLALILAVFLGAGVFTVVVAVTATMWAKFARMIRGEVLSVRGRDYVTLAKIAGVPTHTIVVRHILPNVTNTLLVVSSLLIGQVILLEASLSFLGLGLPPGAPAWGIMVSEGRALLTDAWWLSLFPGLIIVLVVTSTNLLGDWLQKAMAPGDVPEEVEKLRA
jgi:peptide/nickel transport system permease protein